MFDPIDKFKLTEAGFTDKEIIELSRATTPTGKPQNTDLSSPAWVSALKSRRNFTNTLRQEFKRVHKIELDRKRYEKIVDRWYKNGLKKSPWDWLKITYQPRKKTDFITAAKNRINNQQRDLINKGFKIK
jgi:hypothetical protein